MNRTYHDAAEALSNYPSLSTRTDIYSASYDKTRRIYLRYQHTRMDPPPFSSASAGRFPLPFAAQPTASRWQYGCLMPTLEKPPWSTLRLRRTWWCGRDSM